MRAADTRAELHPAFTSGEIAAFARQLSPLFRRPRLPATARPGPLGSFRCFRDHGAYLYHSFMARPPMIVSTADVPESPGRWGELPEIFGLGRPVGHDAGLQRIGLHVVRLQPGMRSSYPHAEEDEEEFVYVLEGEVDAWIDGELHPMRAGDLAAFPAGTGISHTFLNQSDRDAVLLVGGERTKDANRWLYPKNPELRERMPEGKWWDDAPPRELGPHDGTPRRRGSP